MELLDFINDMYDCGLAANEIDFRVQQIMQKQIDKALPFLAVKMDRIDVLVHLMKGSKSPNMYGESSIFYINGFYESSKLVSKPRMYYVKHENLMDIAQVGLALEKNNIKYAMYHPGTISKLLGDIAPFKQSGIIDVNGNPISFSDEQVIQLGREIAHVNKSLFEIVAVQPELMHGISPRQFEELVAELLDRNGFEVSLTPISNDGGVDIYAAKKDNFGSFLYLVQCKRNALNNKVGVGVVRDLYGVLNKQKATAGLVVTSSYFTKGAAEFQSEIQHQMSLWDYTKLVSNIQASIKK